MVIPKIKTVDKAKLEAMSDAALRERIQKSDQKLEAKRARFLPVIAALDNFLKAYTAYRSADTKLCEEILKAREGKRTALPAGSQAGKPEGNGKQGSKVA